MKQFMAKLDSNTSLLVLARDAVEARSIAFGQLVLAYIETGRMATITEVEEVR